MVAPPTPFAPSTSAPSSSAGGVTLDAIMAQLQRMDAYLDTLTTKMFQVNACVGCIARRRLALVALWSLPLLLSWHPRTMMTSTTMMMMMRMEMLALPVLTRCLLDTLTL